ncbi:LysR family transcriptional regulator [Thiolinea disciformis]|uniref:LysR family transcriptional regulator n=1 Tax=Thiolinea disciformis TaxID=125614 RepID=UPI000369ED91|nr:LysR family transcriptional regulator [Thiolinea disciformis]
MISRKYLYLIALAREKHFGRAAAASHISPSTLSAAIRDIEVELGVAVVNRGRSFAGLTREGQCVVEHAIRLAATAEGLRQELRSLCEALTGHLTLGVIPTALTVVASLTAAFARHHPQVNLEVRSLGTNEILKRMQQFDLDAGIMYVESGLQQQLFTVPLWDESHVFLCPLDSELANRETITWYEATHTPLCLLTSDMQNRKMIDAIFSQLGYSAEPSLETNSIISMLAHVSAGGWSAILPQNVLELIGVPAGVKVLALTEPNFSSQTGLVVAGREPWPPLLKALIQTAKQMAVSPI